MTINNLLNINNNYPVDFSYYSASGPLQLFQSQVGNLSIPPYGLTTLNYTLTTPSNKTTAFSVVGLNTSNFVGGPGVNAAGTVYGNVAGQYPNPIGMIYIYQSNIKWALIGYTVGPTGQVPVTTTNFNYCFVIDGYNGGTNLTFTVGASPIYIYDPRWATYTASLSTLEPTSIVFDAIDSLHLDLPNSNLANIVNYHWDFGNGTQADGPVVETQYWYTGSLNYAGEKLAAPTQVSVTLTAIDINNNIYYVTHPVIFNNLYDSIGGALTPGYDA